MYLKKALWSEGLNLESQSQSQSSSSSTPAVADLVNSLHKRRLYREVTLALRTGLRDARAEFSFLRVRGLRSILKFLRSVAESDSMIRLFCHGQSLPELQVVPVLFENSFKQSKEEQAPTLDHIFSVEPMKITSPSTDTEIALALRVLEGCCLLHRESTALAHQHKAIKDFEACNGFEKITELIKDKLVEESIRIRCGEFLLLLIGHVNGRERPPMATIHEDMKRLMGERSASLIWAASQFGSTLDPEQRQMALHIQARRVLESLDLY
ncbi:uncharacterized protein LOC122664958 isoform X2 [Telopea speciosissima]|uniref:uncharacterized protein LOC122664958 isoform X2 n=1 Tax=Telopea speciosissima TaxID=54955 RepID=UPI001CC38E6D|nr:uncharacterized protein LOC122664958 isoform X2 [Telopea speciosissima]